MNPELKFQLNKKLNKEICKDFLYLKRWRRLHGKPILAYPKLKKLIQKMQKIWQEREDIDYLLKKILPQ